jgi:peptidoglycan L-alanyl-D-glutamate endopeptidase CwlK
MSAGNSSTEAMVSRDLGVLAPKFANAVRKAIAECNEQGLDAYVYEGYRSAALQAIYYARGRTVIPPTRTVTNARTNLNSWHGYGLAVDVISRSKRWSQPDSWFKQVAEVFKRHGLKWGGDWKSRDLPHFQWGRCKASPSDRARQIYAERGMKAVWTEVGAA